MPLEHLAGGLDSFAVISDAMTFSFQTLLNSSAKPYSHRCRAFFFCESSTLGRNNIRRNFAKPRMAFPLGAGK
jgi:hypothetical protein